MLNAIGNAAFDQTENLRSVTFNGTLEDAGKLIIGLSNASLINATWTCTDSIGSYPAYDEGILSPDFDWHLDFNGTLVVSGRSAMPDCSSTFHAPWNRYAAQAVVIPGGVAAIPARAFAGSAALRYVSIPASVTDIADDAFDGCQLSIICANGTYAEEWALAHGFACIDP